MARQTIYQRYDQKAADAGIMRNTRESLEWFRKTIRKESNIKNLDKATAGLRNRRIEIGGLYAYEYSPKYAEKLPVWDKFPLVLILSFTTNGWFGINFHYLPPVIRSKILSELNLNRLNGVAIAKKFTQSDYGKFALKKYIATNLKSRPKAVPKDDWEIAVQLPFENFQKSNARSVWRKVK